MNLEECLVPKITEYFEFGEAENLNLQDLLERLERMYTDLAIAINKKPDLFERATDGQIGDTFLSNGTININSTTDKVEMLTNHPTTTTVTWVTLAP